MKRNKNASFFATVAFLSAGYTASASDLYVIGQVDRISNDSITVLGQILKVETAPSETLLAVGQLVIVDAESAGNEGLKAASIQRFRAPYIPGASDVALAGVISKYDPARGYLTINGLSVYIVDAVSGSNVVFTIGQKVEILGRQPVPGGVLLASRIWMQGTAGAGLLRNAATAQLKALDDVQESVSGGVDASLRNTLASVRSDVTTQAIIGTGRSLGAIVGTGVIAQAIVGTGRSLGAIVGTGITTEAIVGTGRSANAIVGTGR